MNRDRAIPDGYQTVGQVAKRMGVTVRTLQYYDREGLLKPSGESEGGRRLYTDRDVIRLHQILSLKHLGFSLEAIRENMVSLDTPEQVAQVLAEQAAAVREKIRSLTETLQDIEALRAEVLHMQTVDFKKYADIVANLQMKNDFYWLIKHFDEKTLDHIRNRFDQASGQEFIQRFLELEEQAISLAEAGTAPESEEGQAFARKYWAMIEDFTGGDWSLLPKLIEIGQAEGTDPGWKERQSRANAYVGPALDAYFAAQGIQLFPGSGPEKPEEPQDPDAGRLGREGNP